MTQKEAIEEALHRLGGRAKLRDIYPLAIEIGDFCGSKDKHATIRRCLQKSPKSFRPSPDKPDGWWELISYQEEIAARDKRIKELESEVERLENQESADAFVKKLLKEAKKLFKRDVTKADGIRQILYKVGREDAAETLDKWIEEKEKPTIGRVDQVIVSNNGEVNHANSMLWDPFYKYGFGFGFGYGYLNDDKR